MALEGIQLQLTMGIARLAVYQEYTVPFPGGYEYSLGFGHWYWIYT